MRSASEDRRVAIHEAGHCAAGHELGEAVAGITIEPHQVDGRFLNGRVSRPRLPSDLDGELRFNRVIILVAGAMAERLFAPTPKPMRGKDRSRAEFHARIFCQTREGRARLIEAAEAEAEGILRRHRDLVLALADHLCIVRTMTGSEAEGFVSDFEAARLARTWRQTGRLGVALTRVIVPAGAGPLPSRAHGAGRCSHGDGPPTNDLRGRPSDGD